MTLRQALEEWKQTPLEDIPNTPEYVELIKEIEFGLQRLWKFPENANYHRHWFEDPKCECPTQDNYEMLGTSSGWVNHKCPLHGSSEISEELRTAYFNETGHYGSDAEIISWSNKRK